jgi:small multidrug resistance family-3 protein
VPGPAVSVVKTLALFAGTAVAEIIGCYLPYRWLRHAGPAWYLAPAAVSLAAFAYLLTLHPTAAGRTYAAYGGIYVAVALLWLWIIDGQTPDRWDLIGGAITIAGMLVIVFGPRAR